MRDADFSTSLVHDGHQVRAGDLVVVRRARWRVVDVRAYDACQVVTLPGLGRSDRRRRAPRADPVRHAPPPRAIAPASASCAAARWRRALPRLVAADAPPGSLRAAHRAPHRADAVPARARAGARPRRRHRGCCWQTMSGWARRFRPASSSSELRARGAVDRVLILTPAGLREQWAQRALATLRHRRRRSRRPRAPPLATTLPVGVNPWSTLRGRNRVGRLRQAPRGSARGRRLLLGHRRRRRSARRRAGDSDRRAAVHALASRASYVLLLTATPHSGDRRAFEALCALGAVDSPDDPPLVVFRRTRLDVGIGATRRIHTIAVSQSAEERRMHGLLARYSAAVRSERARSRPATMPASRCPCCTSARSRAPGRWHVRSNGACRRSRQRRSPWTPSSWRLPLGDPYGDLVAADEPPAWPPDLRLSDTRRERRLLTTLASSACCGVTA